MSDTLVPTSSQMPMASSSDTIRSGSVARARPRTKWNTKHLPVAIVTTILTVGAGFFTALLQRQSEAHQERDRIVEGILATRMQLARQEEEFRAKYFQD